MPDSPRLHGRCYLHASSTGGDTLHAQGSQVCLSLLPALGKGHVESLGDDNPPVHLCYGFGSFLRRGEADKAEASRAPSLVAHHFDTGDVAKFGKLFTQSLVVKVFLQVLHIEVDTLVPVCASD